MPVDPSILENLNSATPTAPESPTAPTSPVAPVAPAAPTAAQTVSQWPSSTDALASDEPKIPGTVSPRDFGRALDNNPPSGAPGSWAASVLASFQNVLAGITAPGKVPNGGGALEGVAAAMANRRQMAFQNQQIAAQRQQQAIENQREDTRLSIEQQKALAAIAESHSNEVLHARLSRNADAAYQQDAYKFAQEAAKPLLEAGATKVGQNLTSDQLQDLLHTRGFDATKIRSFIDGYVPTIGSDGKPVLDSDGEPKLRPTWTLISPVPGNGQVTLDANQAKYLSDNGQGNITEGQRMPDEQYTLLRSRAQTQQGVQANVDHIKSETAKNQSEKQHADTETRAANLTIQERQQNDAAKKIFAPYLAQANGDAVIGLQRMAADPKQAKNLGMVEQLYGPGNLEKVRVDTLKSLDSTINEASKTLSEHAKPGAEPLDADEAQSLRNELVAAQGKKNQYLGLNPSDPPAFAQAKQLLDPLPPQARIANIAKIADPAARAYLYRIYGIQPPQAPRR